jgi:hypothetical protein
MRAGNSFNAPLFISAKSPQALAVAMLKNNILHGQEFQYFDIQFANGKWYAWYYINQRNLIERGLESGT